MAKHLNPVPKELVSKLTTFRSWLATEFPSGTTASTVGGPVRLSDLVSQLDQTLTRHGAVDQAHRQWQAALATRTRGLAADAKLALQCRTLLRALLGSAHPLQQHTYLRGPGGANKLSSHKRLIAAEKLRNTRKLRNTLGKRQKAKLKSGPVKVEVVTKGK